MTVPIRITDRAFFHSSVEPEKQKGYLNRIYEAVVPKLFTKKTNPESRIYNSFTYAVSAQDVDADVLIDYAKKTPQLDLAIESLVELIMGVEINITCDDEEAKKICDNFSSDTNLYDVMRTGLRDELVTGDLVFEKVGNMNIERIVEIDPLALWDIQHDIYGNITNYVLNTQEGYQNIPPEKVIHFKYKQVGKEFWGRSLFHSLAISRTVGNRTTRPMIEQIWAMEDAMTGTFVNHAYPMMVINYKNVNDEQLEKEARKIKDWQPGDKLVQSTNEPPTIDIYESTTAGKYESYVKHIAEVLMMGTGFPYEIFLGNYTSRSSSETSDDLIMKKVRAHQKYLGNKLKQELFRNILMADPRWNTPDKFNALNLRITFESGNYKEMTVPDVKGRVESGIWSIEDARNWDKENCGVDLEDIEMLEPEKVTPNPVEQEAMKTYQMVQEEIKKDRMQKRAKQIKKKVKKNEY